MVREVQVQGVFFSFEGDDEGAEPDLRVGLHGQHHVGPRQQHELQALTPVQVPLVQLHHRLFVTSSRRSTVSLNKTTCPCWLRPSPRTLMQVQDQPDLARRESLF